MQKKIGKVRGMFIISDGLGYREVLFRHDLPLGLSNPSPVVECDHCGRKTIQLEQYGIRNEETWEWEWEDAFFCSLSCRKKSGQWPPTQKGAGTWKE